MTELEVLRQEIAALRKEIAELKAAPRDVHYHGPTYMPQQLPMPPYRYQEPLWGPAMCGGQALDGLPGAGRNTALNEQVKRALDWVNGLSPEEREAHFDAQKKAWVKAEMAFGDEGTRVVR